MTQKVARQSGVLLDREQFAYQLALRLCTARRLARLAGVHEVLVSRARHGHPIAERSLRKIVKALLAILLQPGAELLVAVGADVLGEAREAEADGGFQVDAVHVLFGGAADLAGFLTCGIA